MTSRGGLRRIGRDLKRRHNVDAYVVAAVAVVLAVLSLVGDLIGDNLRWAVALAALSLLVYRITLPDSRGDYDSVLQDRTAFDDVTFTSRLGAAKQLWIFGPTAVNLLVATAEGLQRTVLAKPDGVVRVAVLDPTATTAVSLAARQLDDALDYPVQTLPDALSSTIARLRSMMRWDTPGRLEHRFTPYNPGFSLVAIDPHAKSGVVIVEFHGFHNESTSNRMHVELHRRDSEQWFSYWVDQFEHLWTLSREPDEAGNAADADDVGESESGDTGA